MVAQPWKFFSEVDPDREYLAMSTFLPLEKYGMISAFRKDTRLVEGQLAASEGLIGYALRVKFLHRHFWTLSIWKDESDLMAFKETPPHREMMGSRTWRLGKFKSVRWRLPGTDVPPTWPDALERLAAG